MLLRSSKSESKNAHLSLVLAAAHAVLGILHRNDLPCAVFGSLACKMYGSVRCPKDVDLLVFPPYQTDTLAEDIKRLIVDSSPRHFFLTLPRDPAATYRILHFRELYGGPDCKVDILIPGIMHLPSIHKCRIVFRENIPLLPFAFILLHKLQGWDDHRNSEETHKKGKQHQDAGDLRRMMALASTEIGMTDSRGERITIWDDEELFGEEFMRLTRERVVQYCKAFPDRKDGWEALGFETEGALELRVGVLTIVDAEKDSESPLRTSLNLGNREALQFEVEDAIEFRLGALTIGDVK